MAQYGSERGAFVWVRVEENADLRKKKGPASACGEPGSARSGAKVWEVNCHWQKGPASANAEPGSARSGAEVGEIKCHWHFIYGRSGVFRISARSTR